MKEINSRQNQFVKELKKLHTHKGRKQTQEYMVEGFHLIEEAKKADVSFQSVIFTKKAQTNWSDFLTNIPDEQKILVSDEVMEAISTLPSPQGILAVVKNEKKTLPNYYSGKWLLLDNVQDPGNVGTMIRSADAAGFTGVIIGEGTADIYSPKVLRSMQGSNFHIPIYQADLQVVIEEMSHGTITVYGTQLNEEAQNLRDVPKNDNVAIIMGNEGVGVNPKLLSLTDKDIYIEMRGQVESLNVSVAAGIIMFHFS
ncbi:MAG: RNA methyltransferase [Streptococcaceae bacterium]|jgi:TrmH family RNA methyltransferase|nr:RNA methyltransferase [Streptococcaceae bacterium]